MSVIMHEVSVGGTTIGLRIVTESGDEIDFGSAGGLTSAIEDSPIFTEDQAEGAVVFQRDLSARGMDRPARQKSDQQTRSRGRAP